MWHNFTTLCPECFIAYWFRSRRSLWSCSGCSGAHQGDTNPPGAHMLSTKFCVWGDPHCIPMAKKFVLVLAISCGGASFKRKARSTQLVRSDPGHLGVNIFATKDNIMGSKRKMPLWVACHVSSIYFTFTLFLKQPTWKGQRTLLTWSNASANL